MANIEEIGENTGLGYDLGAKTFTVNNDYCNEMIKVTSIIFYMMIVYNQCVLDKMFLVFYVLLGEPEVWRVSV